MFFVWRCVGGMLFNDLVFFEVICDSFEYFWGWFCLLIFNLINVKLLGFVLGKGKRKTNGTNVAWKVIINDPLSN